MKNLNYIVAIILILLWVVGFFNHFAGYSIHLLFIGALALLFINIIHDDEKQSNKKNINNKRQRL